MWDLSDNKETDSFDCYDYTELPPPQLVPPMYVFFGADDIHIMDERRNQVISPKVRSAIDTPGIIGIQKLYFWKQLEKGEGEYDFSPIHRDLKLTNDAGKILLIQLQDRSFSKDNPVVPAYLRDPKNKELYSLGVAQQLDRDSDGGWIAKQWIPGVRSKFVALINALGKEFNGKIAGINLPETATHFDDEHVPEDFTEDSYFAAELQNIKALKKSFPDSLAIQYVNFFPGEWNNDKGYMQRTFEEAEQFDFALGGPDTIPCRNGQMKNSYPFFRSFNDRITSVMAVQSPDYKAINTRTGKPFTIAEFYSFSQHYLGSDIIIWDSKEPEFTDRIQPFLKSLHSK